MFQITRRDKSKDIGSVDQFGFVDLVNASINGAVPSDLNVNPAGFDSSGELDPNSIIGKPSDVFEGLRMQDNVAKEYHRKVSDIQNTTNSGGTNPPE